MFAWKSFHAARHSERPAESSERPAESSERPAESSEQPAESPAAADVAEPAAAPQIVVSMHLSPMVEPFKAGDYVRVAEDNSTLVRNAAFNGTVKKMYAA